MLCLLLAGASPLRPQQPAVSDKPLIRANANEVLLDIVVRDKHGRPVRDLQKSDVEITDDGVKQTVTAFRLVERKAGEAVAAAPGATSTAGTGAPAYDPLRQVRLVTLVFERLGLDGRRLSRQAALDLLKNESGPNVFFAVFTIDQRLSVLQQFTADRELLRRAIEKATSGAYSQFGAESEAIKQTLEQSKASEGADEQMSASHGANASAVVDQKMAEMTLNMLRFADMMAREQQGRSSIFSLLSIVREQFRLPGRKTVLYFSQGLWVPPNLDEQFKSVISAANRANVSVYAVDARGLLTAGQNNGAVDDLTAATSASRSQMRAAASGQQQAVRPEQAKIFDNAENSLRANTQNSLASLAEGTGGFLIANTNDLRAPLRRVAEDIDLYYEIAYTPAIGQYDGHFRRIAVHVERPELRLQARNGYFALPPQAGAVLFPYELPLLKALDTKPVPRGFGFQSAGLRFQQTNDGAKCAFVLEVPMKNIGFTQDKARQEYRTHLSLLALLKDGNGAIVHKFSKDVPLEGPLNKMAGFQEGNFIFTDQFFATPGRYTLEAAVLDREADKVTARKSAFVVPPAPRGVSISSISLIRRLAPHTGEADRNDPFQFQGGQITPTLSGSVRGGKDTSVAAYFVIYPDAKLAEKPQLTLEFYQEGKLVGRGSPELPGPDAEGRIPYVATTSAAAFQPGNYELRAIVKQGNTQAEEHALFQIEP